MEGADTKLEPGQGAGSSSVRCAVLLTVALGLYWAWISCHLFGTIMVPFASDRIAASESIHLASLASCALLTLAIPFLKTRAWFLRVPLLPMACALSMTGSLAVVAASSVGGAPLVCSSLLSGLGEALMLYYLCSIVNPAVGAQSVLSIFSGAMATSGLIYILVYSLGGMAAAVVTALIPGLIVAVVSVMPPSRFILPEAISEKGSIGWTAVAPTAGGRLVRGLRSQARFPWKVVVGFSVFGLAFGLLRGLPAGAETSFSEYYLIHEACRMATGVAVLAIANRAANKYWATSSLGIMCFVAAFLLAYFIALPGCQTLINVTATLGYSGFELLMWVIIFEITSETSVPLEIPFGYGRGLMQIGIVCGTVLTLFLPQVAGIDFAPLFQTTVVVMLVLMLGLFSDRNMSELWGAKKNTLAHEALTDETLSAMLEDAFSLSSREREVAVLLTKGRSEPFIAENLCLSRSTIHSHIVRIYAKAGVHSRQELLTLIDDVMVRR